MSPVGAKDNLARAISVAVWQYRYRIKEIDEDWLAPTQETSFDYAFLQPGEYTFEVQAIDRDLNYSLPASLTLKVVPPWYKKGWIAIPSGGGILALLICSIVLSVRVIHQRRQIAEQERQSRQEVVPMVQIVENILIIYCLER